VRPSLNFPRNSFKSMKILSTFTPRRDLLASCPSEVFVVNFYFVCLFVCLEHCRSPACRIVGCTGQF
jgi:hypothetical protein